MTKGILVVEDDNLLQMYWEDVCDMVGVTIGGMASTVMEAMTLLDEKEFSGAVLDVNLIGETTETVADRLQGMNLPVIVCTGSHAGSLPASYNGFSVIEKPFTLNAITDALQIMI